MTEVSPTRETAWHNRDFRRLWAGSSASMLGAEIAEIALPLLALLTLSASATELSTLRVAQFIPFLVATLPLGLLVDRRARHRLRLMIGADLGRFVLVGSIPLAIWVGVSDMAVLYAVVFAAGTLTVLYDVASFSFLPTIVAPEHLVDANGKLQATQSASEMGGRGIGGVAVQVLSAPLAVAINAVGYLASAICLSRIGDARPEHPDPEAAQPGSVPPPAPGTSPSATSARAQVWEGLRVALTHRYIRPLLGEATTFNFFNEIMLLGLMLWTVRDLGLTAATIGLVFTAGGIGSFLGAWFGARLTGRYGYGRVLLLTLLLGNGAPLALFLHDRTASFVEAFLCAVFVVMGVGIGIANTHAVSLRQTALPAHLNGRTNAAYRLVSWGVIPLGAATGGLVAAAFGGRTAMLVGAAGVAAATLWVAASRVPRLTSIADAAWSGATSAGVTSTDAG